MRDNTICVHRKSLYGNGTSKRVVNVLLLAIDGRQEAILVLLDLSFAFDTLDHDQLLQRLSNVFSFSGSTLRRFSSYLSDQKQFLLMECYLTHICL